MTESSCSFRSFFTKEEGRTLEVCRVGTECHVRQPLEQLQCNRQRSDADLARFKGFMYIEFRSVLWTFTQVKWFNHLHHVLGPYSSEVWVALARLIYQIHSSIGRCWQLDRRLERKFSTRVWSQNSEHQHSTRALCIASRFAENLHRSQRPIHTQRTAEVHVS